MRALDEDTRVFSFFCSPLVLSDIIQFTASHRIYQFIITGIMYIIYTSLHGHCAIYLYNSSFFTTVCIYVHMYVSKWPFSCVLTIYKGMISYCGLVSLSLNSFH